MLYYTLFFLFFFCVVVAGIGIFGKGKRGRLKGVGKDEVLDGVVLVNVAELSRFILQSV